MRHLWPPTLFSSLTAHRTSLKVTTLVFTIAFPSTPNQPAHTIYPANLRLLIAATGDQSKIPAFTTIFNEVSRPYLCPYHCEQTLGVPPSPLDGRMFEFDGYLHKNQGFNIEIPDTIFNLVPDQILVPTVATILT